MNFYTANGWAGSNYDSKLQTKDIAKKVREFAKKNFPAFKFSVRTEWSMYTDSMYIVLKSGPCAPFVEGSKLANRGRFETMSSVKSWGKDGFMPEVFAALDGVTSYAASFRYDDSDGMQDYFDTNFYLKIEIDDDYTVIEPKAKKVKGPKQEEPKAEPVEASSVEGLEIVDYSEKAIAVFGETKEKKDQFKELGGKFNPALRYGEGKRAGWIFSKKQADKVRALLAPSSKEDELYFECKEEFGEMINNSINNVRMIPESVDTTECELTVNISVNGNDTNLYLYSWCGSHIDDYMTGVYYYEDELTYDEAYNLAEKFNEYRGHRVCSDGSDELRINFATIDEAVSFEEWLKEATKEVEDTETLVIPDYEKYGLVDYESVCDEMDGFKLGEVAFDQCGEIGIILAFYDLAEVRLNSNGVCCIGNLRKCPKDIAEKEVKYMDVIRPEKQVSNKEIHFEEFQKCYDIMYNVGAVKYVVNYDGFLDDGRKYGVQYDGISPESSLYKALPGIIETNNKLEAQTFSITPKELPANVEFYEKMVTGKRYTVNDKPDKFGCFHVIDTLDNAACDFYQTKEEANNAPNTLTEF